jgi:hypothetical protein
VLAVMGGDAEPCNRREADHDEPHAPLPLPARELLFAPSASTRWHRVNLRAYR